MDHSQLDHPANSQPLNPETLSHPHLGPGQDLHDKLNALVVDLVSRNIDLQFAKKELESAYIREILRGNGGNIGISARVLGIHRNTLSKRIKELGIGLRQG